MARFVVEVAGPAGAGKTTVAQHLTARPQFVGASVWNLPRPLYAASAVRTTPAIAALIGATRWLPWEETEQLIRLDALDHFLRRLPEGDRSVVVLDEGPVFAFAWFRVLGHPCFRDGRRDAWWRAALAHWAARLDVIVLLDGADPLLVDRLRSRTKDHPLKSSSDQELYHRLPARVRMGHLRSDGPRGDRAEGHLPGKQRRASRGARGPGPRSLPGHRPCRLT